MRAVRYTRTGGPEVLETVEIEAPEPGPGEVLIDVTHSGVHFADVMFRRGRFPLGLPAVPGIEAAGTVAALGDGVTGLEVGTPVAAVLTGFGGHAEQAVASAATTIALEGTLAGLSPLLAAATACNGATAVGTLRGAARLAEGERVLVLGAAGALGALLGDLARSYGAGLVVGAAGTPQRAALAAGRGYHRALTYGELESQAMELTDGRGFDVVVDPIGGPLRERIRPLLAVLGRHVVIGDAADRDTSMAANQVWYDSYSLAGYNLGALIGRRPDLFRAQFAEALRLVADGTLRPEVEQIGWDAVAEAHRRLEGRSAEVKYVLRTA